MKKALLLLLALFVYCGVSAQNCLPEPKMKDAEIEQALINAYNKMAKINPTDFKGEAKAISIPVLRPTIDRNENSGLILKKLLVGIMAYTENGKCYTAWYNFASDYEGGTYGEWYCEGKMSGHKPEKLNCDCLQKKE